MPLLEDVTAGALRHEGTEDAGPGSIAGTQLGDELCDFPDVFPKS